MQCRPFVIARTFQRGTKAVPTPTFDPLEDEALSAPPPPAVEAVTFDEAEVARMMAAAAVAAGAEARAEAEAAAAARGLALQEKALEALEALKAEAAERDREARAQLGEILRALLAALASNIAERRVGAAAEGLAAYCAQHLPQTAPLCLETAPDVIERLRADFENGGDAIDFRADPSLVPGQVRARWGKGSATFDPTALEAAAAAALSELEDDHLADGDKE